MAALAKRAENSSLKRRRLLKPAASATSGKRQPAVRRSPLARSQPLALRALTRSGSRRGRRHAPPQVARSHAQPGRKLVQRMLVEVALADLAQPDTQQPGH